MILLLETTKARIQHEGRKTYIEGLFMSANVVNKNKRYYDARVIEQAVDRVQDRIRQGTFFGQLGHPKDATGDLSQVSHVVQSLTKRGNNWIGRARVIDEGAGRILKSILEASNSIGVSSRGYGSAKNKDGVAYIQDDFTLCGVDCVADPSGPNCWVNAISEGLQNRRYSLMESVVARRLLNEMAPMGNSVKDLPRDQFDVSAYGYKWSAAGDFSRDSKTFIQQSEADTGSILSKIGELQSKANWQIEDEQDAASLKKYIDMVKDPFVKQQMYQALIQAVGAQRMKMMAAAQLTRLGKFNK